MARLERQLGEKGTAGAYLDPTTGQTMVTITDPATVPSVRAVGATPVLVSRSGARLRDAVTALARMPRLPGTAWGVDPTRDKVTVLIDDTVSSRGMRNLRAVTRDFADAVTVRRVQGSLRLDTAGGDGIDGGFRCSAGFNTHVGPYYFLLTAGHCGNAARYWFSDSQPSQYIGPVVVSHFPGNDYAIISYDGTVTHPSTVDLYGASQDISSAADAYVGEAVQRSGSTSHLQSGYVIGVDMTVNYPEGTVNNLIETTACAEAGDSGGPLFSGSTALGLTSGGYGDCQSGGITFFQPITPILNDWGLSVD